MDTRILIVDDEFSVREVLAGILRRAGHIADTASSGEAAIDRIQEVDYDLIILDLRMPGLNGVDTLRELRKYCPDLPIYISSGFYGEYIDELREVAREGLDFELMDKPIGRNQLISVVEGVLCNKAQRG
jgi:CheY-like chemotaxis protein